MATTKKAPEKNAGLKSPSETKKEADSIKINDDVDEFKFEVEDNSTVLEEANELIAYERGKFTNTFQYLCTCISYAIGFSNIWRFPYLCYKNGGGAFLIPYTVSLFVAGLPMMFLEMSLGQFSSQGPITVWRLSPMFEGIGWGQMLVSFYVTLFYAVLSAISSIYFVMSLRANLLWRDCGHWWNDPDKCHIPTANASDAMRGYYEGAIELPSEGFWKRWMLGDSGTISYYGYPQWKLLLGLVFCWILCAVMLSRGAKSIGRAMYFVALFPYVAITILVLKSVWLPGAAEGIMYYIVPDFGRLLDITVWSDAATQIFFSLGICQGSLLTMSSFNNFSDNVLRNAVSVSIINCVTSFYLGFAIFTIIGSLAHEYDVPIDSIVTSGSSLVFILYPTGLSTFPAAPFWSVVFFFMMIMVGIGSQVGCFETVLAPLSDRFETLQRHQRKFRAIASVVGFLACIPMVTNGGFHLLDIVNTYGGGVNLVVLAMVELVAVAHVYGAPRLIEDIEMMRGRMNRCWIVMWRWVTLIYLFFISILWTINYSSSGTASTPARPRWGVALGWMISASTMLPLVIGAVCVWVKMSHINEAIYVSTRPLLRWGPVLPQNRVGRYAEAEKEKVDDELYDKVSRNTFKQDRFKATTARRASTSIKYSLTEIHNPKDNKGLKPTIKTKGPHNGEPSHDTTPTGSQQENYSIPNLI